MAKDVQKTTIDDLRDQLARLAEAKVDANQSLQKVEADLSSERQKMGAAIASGKGAEIVSDQVVKAQEARARLMTILEAIENQIVETSRKLEAAVEDERKATIARLQAEYDNELIEMVKLFQTIYERSARALNKSKKYNLSSRGLPVVDSLRKSESWLRIVSTGSAQGADIVKRAGVMTHAERLAFLNSLK